MRLSWGVLVIVLLAAAGFATLDRATRHAPHLGFVPARAQWIATTDDVPGVWRAVVSTDFYSVLTEEVPSPFEPARLALRQTTGMRLTPARWMLWMGNTCTIAEADQRHVVSLHPGLLMRATEPIARWARGYSEVDGVVDAGEAFYAWRDGYLVLSTEESLVRACLQEDAQVVPKPDAERTLRWRGSISREPVAIELVADERFPLEIIFDSVRDVSPPPRQLPPGPWQSEIARLQGLPLGTWRRIVAEACNRFANERTEQHVKELIAVLPEDASNTAVILTDLQVDEGRLIVEPDLFVLAAPVDTAPQPEDAIAFYWNDLPGWVLPWWGQSLTLCHAIENRRAYYTTSQSVMSDYIGAAGAPGSGPVGRAYVNWEMLSEKASTAVLQMADFELIPHMNRQNASARVLPYIRAAARLGETVLVGNAEDGKLVLRGFLASPLAESGEDGQ